MRNLLLFAVVLAVLFCAATTTSAATTGNRITPDGPGMMTHGGIPATPAEIMTSGYTLVINAVAYHWNPEHERYENANGFWYRFDDYIGYPYQKWIGQYGNNMGQISTCAFWR